MIKYSTKELENWIKSVYSKLKAVAEMDGIYTELNVLFSDKLPIMFEGDYVFSDDLGYHYAGTEKGKIKMHKITDDLFEISYWIFSFSTFMMAADYEHLNRIKKQDTRRLIFKKQLELLELLGENYRKRGEIDIDETLKEYPYNDELYH